MTNGKKVGIICTFIATFCFSLKSIFAKVAYVGHMSPIIVLAWRSILALPLFLIPFIRLLYKKHDKDSIHNILFYGVLGGLLYLSSSLCDFIGLTYINASIERAVLFTFPIFVFFFSWRREYKFPKKAFLFAIISQVGLIIMLAPSINKPNWSNIISGVGFVFLSAILWASFIVFSKKAVTKIGTALFTSSYMCITCFTFVIIALLFKSSEFGIWNNSFNEIWPIIALAIVCTIIPSYMTSYGIEKIGDQMTAIISGSGPIITLWVDQLVFHHALHLNEIIGSIIVAISITYIAIFNKANSYSKNTKILTENEAKSNNV